jgi:prevent-host-death family protein
MCVMERVGVRELRQNLSKYLDRVKAGEALEVTEHGHPVATLIPRRASDDPIERMIADGRLQPAELPWESLPPPLPASEPYAATKGLMEDREGKE